MNGRVLVIEDDPDIRETLVDALEDSGHPAFAAWNGKDALEKLRFETTAPCLILLDLMMPVMDGRSFREEQLRIASIADVPVIVLSAYRDVEANVQGMDVAAFLQKPPDLTELVRLVRSHCR